MFAIVCALASSLLICVFFIDLEHMYIPDRLQIILLSLGIVAIFFDQFSSWDEKLIGFAVGGGVMLIIYYASLWLLKREGLGFGDVKLSFVCGLLLGWQRFLLAMFIASISACIVLIPKKYSGKQQKEFPFAPYIAVGVAVALLFGEMIIKWYLAVLGI